MKTVSRGQSRWKATWEWIGNLSALFSLISYGKAALFSLIAILSLGWFAADVKLNRVSARLRVVQEQMEQKTAEDVLRSYFYFIENDELEKAWNLFSVKKQASTGLGYSGFEKWLENFVSFEGLTITDLVEKDSASTKVYLAEYNFKKKGMKPVTTKLGFYLKFNGDKWEIDYSNVLYENGWKDGACEFWNQFPICKPTQ